MGSIELALHTRRDRLCVLKRIVPDAPAAILAEQRLCREAAILDRLHHPSIARLYAVERIGAEQVLVEEFVHGRDLGQLLSVCTSAGVRIPTAVTLDIVARAAAALHYAHHSRRLR